MHEISLAPHFSHVGRNIASRLFIQAQVINLSVTLLVIIKYGVAEAKNKLLL